jgi:transcriptional regulator with XRE-family HTH domain
LAANVRRLRTEQRLSVEEAADRAGMHWRHWQKVESGDHGVTLRTLAKLSVALRIEASELLR